MKKLIGSDVGSYSFNPAAKTVTLGGIQDIRLENLLLITNVTDNIMLYNFASPSLGATMSNNIVTLVYDTATMSDTDNLQVFVDMPDETDEYSMILRRLVKLTEPTGTVDSQNRQRVNVETGTIAGQIGVSGGNVAVTGTFFQATQPVSMALPTSISGQTIGQTVPGINQEARIAYAVGIRANLFFD